MWWAYSTCIMYIWQWCGSTMSLNDIYAQAHNKRKTGGKKRKAREIIAETIREQEECIRSQQQQNLRKWKQIEEQGHKGLFCPNKCKRRKGLPLEGKPTMDALVDHVKKTTEIKLTLHLLCAIHDAISS